jgi:hypothetical protein
MTQLFKKLTPSHKPPTCPNSKQIESALHPPSYSFEINFNIILQSAPLFLKVISSLQFLW